MPKSEAPFQSTEFLEQLEGHGVEFTDLPGWMFRDLVIHIASSAETNQERIDGSGVSTSHPSGDLSLDLLGQKMVFAGGRLADSLDDTCITHVVIGNERSQLKQIRAALSR